MDQWMGGQISEWDESVDGLSMVGSMDERINGWMDQWMGGRINGSINGWTNQ